MTMEANNARYNIAGLLESGYTFKDIARYIGTMRTPLEAFYRGTGKDLDPKQCDKLEAFVMEQL